MKKSKPSKNLVDAMVIEILKYQNVSPVIATMTDDETAKKTIDITKEEKNTKEKKDIL
nr:hypothetical protein [Listeria monocytogenes]